MTRARSDGSGNKEGDGEGSKSDGDGNKEGKVNGRTRDGNGNKEGKGEGGKRDGDRAMARAAIAIAMATKRDWQQQQNG
jgi:hypothetical protein